VEEGGVEMTNDSLSHLEEGEKGQDHRNKVRSKRLIKMTRGRRGGSFGT